MTVPQDYALAARDFEAFLVDAMEALDRTTRHQTFQIVLAAFVAFRDRVTAEQGIAFAQCLPPLLRALFIDGWTPRAEPLPFDEQAEMTEAVKAFRRDHNLAPDTVLPALSGVLRSHVDATRLDRVLATLPPGAAAFWSTD